MRTYYLPFRNNEKENKQSFHVCKHFRISNTYSHKRKRLNELLCNRVTTNVTFTVRIHLCESMCNWLYTYIYDYVRCQMSNVTIVYDNKHYKLQRLTKTRRLICHQQILLTKADRRLITCHKYNFWQINGDDDNQSSNELLNLSWINYIHLFRPNWVSLIPDFV